MPDYRIYLIAKRTRQYAQDITCTSDAEAVVQATAMIKDDEFEVWQGDRMVAAVDGTTGGAPPPNTDHSVSATSQNLDRA